MTGKIHMRTFWVMVLGDSYGLMVYIKLSKLIESHVRSVYFNASYKLFFGELLDVLLYPFCSFLCLIVVVACPSCQFVKDC